MAFIQTNSVAGPFTNLSSVDSGGGGGEPTTPPDDLNWILVTQAHIDAGTKYIGSAGDTLKSISETGDVVTVVLNAVGTSDGTREMTNIAIPIKSILTEVDFDLHDIMIWLVNPTNIGSVSAAIGIALGVNPGPSANMVGIICTSSQRRAQATTSSVSAGAETNTDALGRFICSAASASAEIGVTVSRIGTGGQTLQGSATIAADLSDADQVVLCIGAGSYSGAVTVDSTVSTKIYAATILKIGNPET